MAPVTAPPVLVFRVGQLGDTLVAMPAMRAIREKHRDRRLILLTDRHHDSKGFVSSWELLEPTGWFDEVIYYAPGRSRWESLINMARLLGRLRGLGVGEVYDLAPERTAAQSRRDRFFFESLAGIARYHGFGPYTNPARGADGTFPACEPEWKRLLAIAGCGVDPSFRLPLPPAERRRVAELFDGAGIAPGDRVVGIAPGSKMPSKLWPFERFRELGGLLKERYPGLKIVVLGGAGERQMGEELCRFLGEGAANLAGALSLYGSAAALERCRLFVGNDTGTMHLAAMAGTPCVVLFSVRDYPGKWDPFGGNNKILRHDVPCAGCMLEVCDRDNRCLTAISVKQVFDAVEQVLPA